MQKNYWSTFIVVLVTLILTGGIGNTINSDFNVARIIKRDNYGVINEEDPKLVKDDFLPEFLQNSTLGKIIITLGIGGTVIATILVVVLIIMVGFVVDVGQSRFFLDGLKVM